MKDFYNEKVAPKVEDVLEKYEDNKQTVLIILASIGALVLVAGVAYLTYRLVMKYNERFEEELEEAEEEDFFEDEEKE